MAASRWTSHMMMMMMMMMMKSDKESADYIFLWQSCLVGQKAVKH